VLRPNVGVDVGICRSNVIRSACVSFGVRVLIVIYVLLILYQAIVMPNFQIYDLIKSITYNSQKCQKSIKNDSGSIKFDSLRLYSKHYPTNAHKQRSKNLPNDGTNRISKISR